jgi:macrolide transport system ATP-binding/permease protein
MTPVLEPFRNELRVAARQLVANRRFAATVILVLAVGIASTVAIFAFVDAALIKPLPYADPSRLVTAFTLRPDRALGQARNMVSYLNFRDWRENAAVFSSVAAFDIRAGFVLTTVTGSERVSGLRVTGGFFRTLGVVPALGREFGPDDEGVAAAAMVMLSHGAWQRRFGGRPDVIGETVVLQGEPHLVIGVLPSSFHFPMASPADFWTTIRGRQPCWESRRCRSMETVARLANGVSAAAAQGALDGIITRLRAEAGDTTAETTVLLPLNEIVVRGVRPVLLTILGGAGLLMLIACVNVVTLFVARTHARSLELGVRTALGAPHARLFVQFSAEAIVLVACATGLGLALGAAAIRFLKGLMTTEMASRIPFADGLALDLRATLFAVLLALTVCAVFTLAPFLWVYGASRLAVFSEQGVRSGGMKWRRTGRSLVTIELAIALILLVATGLLGQSTYRLLSVDPGFAAEHLAIAFVSPLAPRPAADVVTGAPGEPPGLLARQVAQRLSVVPGVTAVGYADLLPLGGGLAPTSGFRVPGRSVGETVEDHPVRRVSAEYFRALDASLLRGRFFTEGDVDARRNVVIINDTASKLYFPGEDPLGQSLVVGAPPVRQVVGVVADIAEGPLETPPYPVAYVPFDQVGFALVVRTMESPDAVVASLPALVREVRSNVLVQGSGTMVGRLNQLPSASVKRASAWLVGAFAAIALLLGSGGLYAVIAYFAAQRSREIGIRMALGARHRSVYRLVLGEAAVPIAVGIAAGTIGAAATATFWMRDLLFGVGPMDAATLAIAAGALTVSAIAASVVPARRAAGVDPAAALRN